MEQVVTLAGIALALLFVAMSPGPAFIVVSQQAVARSRDAGVITALGVSVGSVVWVMLVILGIAFVLEQAAWLYVVLRLMGGVTKTIPTADYLGLAPANLSGGYTAKLVFALDYAHLAEIKANRRPTAAMKRRAGAPSPQRPGGAWWAAPWVGETRAGTRAWRHGRTDS